MSLENRPELSVGSKFKRGVGKAIWRLNGIPGNLYDEGQEILVQLDAMQEGGVTSNSEEFKELSQRQWTWSREMYKQFFGDYPSQPSDVSE